MIHTNTLLVFNSFHNHSTDYIPVSESVSFPLNTIGATMCVNISIIDDDVFEALEDEFFWVDIDFPGANRVVIDPVSSQVSISDNEGKRIKSSGGVLKYTRKPLCKGLTVLLLSISVQRMPLYKGSLFYKDFN